MFRRMCVSYRIESRHGRESASVCATFCREPMQHSGRGQGTVVAFHLAFRSG